MNSKKSAIEIAKEIVIDRLQEKERQYGNFNQSISKLVKIYNMLYDDKINELTALRVLVLLKLVREGNAHKEDNIVDMIAYLDRLNEFENKMTRYDNFTLFDKIRKWANDKGIISKGDIKTQTVKCIEEVGELSKAILHNDKKEIIDAIGDIVIVLTSLAEMNGTSIEHCINEAYNVIKERKGKMINNNFVKEK